MVRLPRCFALPVRIIMVMVVMCVSNNAGAQVVTFNSPLVDAANRGDEASVLLMLSQGFAVDTKGDYGVTALMRAAYGGHVRLVKVLLGMGADVNVKDIGGATALHAAVRQGHQDVVEELLSYNANVNAADQEGWTPLMRAALVGEPGIMRLLLAKGADPFKVNNAGDYTLKIAADANNAEAVRTLVEKGITNRDNPYVVAVLGKISPGVAGNVPPMPPPVAPITPVKVGTLPANITPTTPSKPIAIEVKQAPSVENIKTELTQAVSPSAPLVLSDKRFIRLQAGTYLTREEAREAWKKVVAIDPKLFRGYQSAVMQLPSRNMASYALVFGQLPNKHVAQQVCTKLWMKNISCFVMETSLTLAQLEESTYEVASVPALPAGDFRVKDALQEEKLQEAEKERDKPSAEWVIPPLPVGAKLVDGLPWTEEEAPKITALPEPKDIDTASILAAGAAREARKMPSAAPQVKPAVPLKDKTVETIPLKKGKVEVAEAIRIEPGQKVTLPPVVKAPPAPVVAPAAALPVKVGEPVRAPQPLKPVATPTGGIFWIQVGNFATQQNAVDFTKVIRQNKSLRGIRLRVVRLPEEAARNEPAIALRLGTFDSETKAMSLCTGALSYLRCTVLREAQPGAEG